MGISKLLRRSSLKTILNYEEYILSLNPVSYWKLDEIAGTLINDSTGFNNGLYSGPVTLNASPLRSNSVRSVGFLSSVASCSFGTHTKFGNLFATANQATILFWFKLVSLNSQNRLFQYFNNATAGTGPYRVWNNNFQCPSDTSIVSMGWNSTNDVQFLGIRKGLTKYHSFKNGAIYLESAGGSNGATVTGHTGGSVGLYFPGASQYSNYAPRCYMSDIAIFDYAVSDQDILNLYNLG